METSKLPSIPGFYAGATIFLTGGTGYLGKLLVEKLLRSCPDIKRIYLLLRPKRKVDGQVRINQFADIPLFNRLKEEQPNFLERLKVMNGDLMELNLGLSEENIRILQEEVKIIFHVAANIKFDDHFKISTFINVRGTRDLMDIAKGMKKLKALMHVSTTYCNTDRRDVQEIVYPPRFDWRKAIEIAENADEFLLQTLSQRFFDVIPNSYVYTKSLAENIIDENRHVLPVAIYRPSIVSPSYEEPFPGWLDNFNNVMGVLMGSYKGVVHAMHQKDGVAMDFMPADLVVKGLIVATVKTGTEQKLSEITPVYSSSSNLMITLETKEVIEKGLKLFREVPSTEVLWYPSGVISGNQKWVYTLKILFHFLPALLLDGVAKLRGKKPMFLKLHSKIERVINVAQNFYGNTVWYFDNHNYLSLLDKIGEEDLKNFDFQFLNLDKELFIRNVLLGGRRYLFKESDDTLPAAIKKEKRMYVIHNTLKYLVYGLFLWKLWSYVGYYMMYSVETLFFQSCQNDETDFNKIVQYFFK